MAEAEGAWQIAGLQVGKPVLAPYGRKQVETGIFKAAVEGPLPLAVHGLQGDGQADLVHHGGPDKAVCCYFATHYPYWEETLGQRLAYGAFGENFTIAGGNEHTVAIGDVLQVGEACVQVSQPRYPCFKLAVRLGVATVPAQVLETGYCGFYVRVLQEGQVRAGDKLQLLRHGNGNGKGRVTIAEALRLYINQEADLSELTRLYEAEGLAACWREELWERLQ